MTLREQGARAAAIKACPRCGQALVCGAAQGACECFELRLDQAQRDSIAAAFQDCLCPRCLREIQTGASVQLPAPRSRPRA